jgi:hypothetical protein
MALQQCPECKGTVSSTANSCPHCGYIKKSKGSKGGCIPALIWIIVILIVFVFLIGVFTPSEVEKFTPTNDTAYHYAESKIKDMLKAPSTADFPSYSERVGHVQRLGNEFTINSWVDSENSFGAKIRTKFSCKVIYEGDYVRLRDVKIGN